MTKGGMRIRRVAFAFEHIRLNFEFEKEKRKCVPNGLCS